MGEDWSRLEVEATVADYFDMFEKEVRGQHFSKTEHRRRLSQLLNSRSDAAIEYKHSNISAIFQENGIRPIDGYKPLFNYQKKLRDVVLSRIPMIQPLFQLVKTQVDEPVALPQIEDILSCLVTAPREEIKHRSTLLKISEPRVGYGVDYVEREAQNQSVGSSGEEMVIRFEKARLAQEGRDDLALKVEQVSLTQGDRAGFDILSFEMSGKERFIEVKTTKYNQYTPFFVSKGEVEFSRNNASDYYLYRPFHIRLQPKLFMKNGSLEKNFNLATSQYIASI